MLADPELHRLGLGAPDVAVAVVELGRVGPVPRHGRTPRGVAFVPRGGLLGDPPRIARGMVGHPVEQHLHAQPVRLGDERVEVVHRAELGIHGPVVADRIVGAERTLAVKLPDRVDRHEPYGIDAHVVQKAQFRGGGPERSFGRKLAHVHLVENGAVAPFGMQIHRLLQCVSKSRRKVRQRLRNHPEPAAALPFPTPISAPEAAAAHRNRARHIPGSVPFRPQDGPFGPKCGRKARPVQKAAAGGHPRNRTGRSENALRRAPEGIGSGKRERQRPTCRRAVRPKRPCRDLLVSIFGYQRYDFFPQDAACSGLLITSN